MSEWISVDTENPREEESVLVLQEGNDVCKYLIIQAQIFEGNWYADHENGLIDYDDRILVAHWQPLPQPPQGK